MELLKEYKDVSFATIFKKRRQENKLKHITGGEYKYVSIWEYNGQRFFQAHLPKQKGYRSWSKCFLDEREAALAVDKKRIERGDAPVNILKKKL